MYLGEVIMAINLYQILEASEAASQETLQTLFEQKSERLKRELEQGSPAAKEQLWFLNQAYETLSHPVKRAAYDDSLKPKAAVIINSHQAMAKPEGLSWQVNALLVMLLASGLIGFGLYLGRSNKKDDVAVQILQTNRTADNDATRANAEKALAEGTVSNQQKLIETQGQVVNRIVSIEESAENRRSRELEYRANAGTEILRQQQERQSAVDQQLEWQRKQYEQEAAVRQSQARIASDRMQSIQIMVQDGRLAEASLYAKTFEERAIIEAAERQMRGSRY
jgi:curved DNA-binding protein CbpA